jgi:hypothetical protein
MGFASGITAQFFKMEESVMSHAPDCTGTTEKAVALHSLHHLHPLKFLGK